MRKRYITVFILSLLSCLLSGIIYFNPPTDYDGGPMLAYNFLFFFPLLIVAFILSLIAIILFLTGKEKIPKTNIINYLPLFLNIPILILFYSVINQIISTDYSDYEPDDMIVKTEKVELPKYTFLLSGVEYKNSDRRIYIAESEQGKPVLFMREYFLNGNFDFYFGTHNDSLLIIIPDSARIHLENERTPELDMQILIKNYNYLSINEQFRDSVKIFLWDYQF